MEEEPSESMGEEYPEEPPKGSRKVIKILALVIALVVIGGAGAWYALSFLGNSPPTAAFSYSTQDLRLFVDASNSTDPDGNIAAHTWDWGDGTAPGSGRTVFHDYTTAGTKTVTLTVTDARSAVNSMSQSILVQALPTPMFVARPNRMEVTFDATRSFVIGGGTITSYEWDLGDGNTASGPVVTHTYATPGRKTVRLTVTDNNARTMSTSRYVSPADSTVGIVYDQFFQTVGCPYEDYWFLRNQSYGDSVLRNAVPCTAYYPWVFFSSSPSLQVINPSFVYTLFHVDAQVRNHPGYNLVEPVFLPVLNPAAQPDPGSYIQLNLTFDYLDTALINSLRPTPFAVGTKYSDGFGYLVRGTITMDLAMSRRIFGVVATNPSEAQAWWTANTQFARSAGSAETQLASWLERNGNGKYDIYNGFEWFYETDITDLNATVAPDGTTAVTVFWDGWGYDVLFARMSYWGSANYSLAVNSPYGQIAPEGWSSMETCWCEKATIDGRITSSLDLNFDAIAGYAFMAWGNWGSDGIPGTSDDLPAWVMEAIYMDYVPRAGSGSPAASGFPNSELRWYEGTTRVHGAPGSYAYGSSYEYINVPTRWKMSGGYSITLVLPRDATNRPLSVPWYDPARSAWNPTAKIGNYVTFMSPITLRSVLPAGDYYLWDARGKVLSFAGPHAWGATSLPQFGSPWIEFGPETAA